jgi:glycosyltransferase involved in cell wall biosynthesis
MGVLEAPAGNSPERVHPHLSGASPDTHATSAQRADKTPIIVHCHLRWDFVWQRPQQIFSRLSQDHPVLFLEEGLDADGEPRLDITEPIKNLVRVVPRFAGRESMSIESQCELVLRLLTEARAAHPLLKGRFESPIQWFYSPATAPFFTDRLKCVSIVYDCMDELANFRFAQADIAQREKVLLSRANVVFTGGYRLYESKSRHNPNTHFYGCGVDVGHFGKARLDSTLCPPETAALSRPILGYFGVIDERLDYALIERLALECRDASVVMVGPFAKIDPGSVPRLPNLHWMGQRAYGELPSFVKTFDVCLMPFALNEATHYINPTKTLEYMAAAKPVVSTAVPDVVRNFTPVVRVAHCAGEFIRAVQEAVASPDQDMIGKGIALARESSWEAIVSAMRGHMLRTFSRRVPGPVVSSRMARTGRPLPKVAGLPVHGGDPRSQGGERVRAASGQAE